MKRRQFNASVGLAALLACAPGAAQWLPAIKDVTVPVESGGVAPWRPAEAAVADPGETGSLAPPASGRTLAEWYVQQGSPAVAVWVDRRLERLPAGWEANARLVIADERRQGNSTETRALTIGTETRAVTATQHQRHPLVKLLEDAVLRELQRAHFRLVDATVAERALTARTPTGPHGDTEYTSLKDSARLLLELALVPGGDTGDGSVALIGTLKHVATGEIVASVRQQAGAAGVAPGTESLARAFVKRLTGTALRS